MARFIRLSQATTAPTGGGDDLATTLRSLAPAGALAKGAGALSGSDTLGAAGTGLSGLLGLTRGIAGGDPGQAVGGAANVGSGLASLAGYPGIASGLSAVGGPLTLATGLASGDPLSSTLGGLQTASTLSGYLGGPTISSGLASLYGALPASFTAGLEGALGIAPAGASLAAGSASELGLGAAGAAGGLGSSLAGGLALGPFALLASGGLHALMSGGGDMFDALFGEDRSQGRSQTEDYQRLASEFPGLVQRRTAGAHQFDTLGATDTPDEISQALGIASSGRSANVAPMAWNLSHRPTATQITPMDLSGWDAQSPELGGHNWGAFLSLMDKGQAAGLDPGGMTGAWNLGGEFGGQGNTTGEDYRTRLGSYGTANQFHGPLEQTQEAQDLGNAVAGIGQHLGIDWAAKDPSGDLENFDAEQLAGYGFKPGAYGPAALHYLSTIAPEVTSNPEWSSYASALDPGNTLATLDPLTLTPRKKPVLPGYYAEQNFGSGGGTA